MTSDMTLRAYFQEEEREERYLTISAMSELGGTTIPSLGSHMYYEGTTVTVTASASSNYYFSHWLLDGIAVYEYPCEVTMNADHSLTAFFSFDGDGGGPGHDCHPWGGEDTPLP